jgi:dTMP kinase
MEIREIIKTNCDSKILLEMFKKDRVEHIENFVCPALSEGKIVVCDRYILSTVCYQETPEHPIEELVKDSRGLLWPDVYFVLYFDEKDANLVCERITSRGVEHDVYDTMEWVKKVNGNFLEMSKYYKNLTYINTNQSLENILAQMMNVIENKIKNK